MAKKPTKQRPADKLALAFIILVSVAFVILWATGAIAGLHFVAKELFALRYDFEAAPYVFFFIMASILWGVFASWFFSD